MRAGGFRRTVLPWLVHALALAILVPACTRLPPPVLLPEVAVEDPAFAATVAAYTDAPVAGGNTVDILLNGDQVFPAQLAAIANARRTITYAQYFWADGAVADALVDALTERCRAGVGVDVLLDGFGALTMSREAVERLRGAGCSVAFFRPLSALLSDPINHRGHRRVLVVDGRVAFTGGVGIGDKWTGNGRLADHWRDTDVRVRGPVVRYLQRAFADSWYEATGVRLGGRAYFPPLKAMGDVTAQVVTSPPERGDVSVHTALLLAIAGARHSILITDPYFVPDRQLTDALLAAVARGVHVAVLTPGEIDANIVRRASRRMLGPLLQAGVKIYEYRAGLLHAKTMVIDGLWLRPPVAADGQAPRHVFAEPAEGMADALANGLQGRPAIAELRRVPADDFVEMMIEGAEEPAPALALGVEARRIGSPHHVRTIGDDRAIVG